MSDSLKNEILALVRKHAEQKHAAKPFVPGETMVPYAGRVFDHNEVEAAVDSALRSAPSLHRPRKPCSAPSATAAS